jgi:hypothetical protein
MVAESMVKSTPVGVRISGIPDNLGRQLLHNHDEALTRAGILTLVRRVRI